MADLHAWLETSLRRTSGRSDMAKAIRYSLNHWNALTLILRDGRACIDNSAAERAMRPVALGRRNWTFADSDAGGVRAAAIYSLIETEKINGLDPEAYLCHVIQRIADHPINRVAEFLPYPCGENRGLDTRPGSSIGSRSAPFRRKRVNSMGERGQIDGSGIKGTTGPLPGLRVAVVLRVAHDLEEFLVA